MNLEELKKKTPAELITQAEKLEIENPSTLRKQEILFAILKKLAQKNEQITGGGVLEVLQDGFGFLRAIESNYLPGPDDIYVSPSQIKKFSLRTGDIVEGEIRAPKHGERYFAITNAMFAGTGAIHGKGSHHKTFTQVLNTYHFFFIVFIHHDGKVKITIPHVPN